jgi:RNA polymerase sigma-70 factor (ECF subfamily)
MQRKTDGELMALIAIGDRPAFEELFNRYGRAVLGYCCRLLGGRSSGEDISQEVWIRTVKHAGNYRPRAGIKAWLFTIARNLALNHLRSERKLTFIGETTADVLSQSLGAENLTVESIEDLLAKAVDRKELLDMVDSLPAAQRIALVIWMTEDMS